MPWLQLKIQADGSRSERIEALLEQFGALSVTLEDSGDQPLLEPGVGETPVWNDTTFTGLFDATADIQLIQAAIQNQLGDQVATRCELLEDKDWEREWMSRFHPMSFGDRLWICPSWQQPPEPNAVNLMLDPGLAFGTGTHETTALCLQWLDQADLAGKQVVDFGCGSGILAIAAAVLGAAKVTCIDNDPQALVATRANGEHNGVLDKLEILAPQPGYSLQAEVVLANILAGPLIELSPLLAGITAPNGYLVLSGILAEQANEVQQAYQPWFQDLTIDQKGDWVRIFGQKST